VFRALSEKKGNWLDADVFSYKNEHQRVPDPGWPETAAQEDYD
jgi:hypothetical protein